MNIKQKLKMLSDEVRKEKCHGNTEKHGKLNSVYSVPPWQKIIQLF